MDTVTEISKVLDDDVYFLFFANPFFFNCRCFKPLHGFDLSGKVFGLADENSHGVLVDILIKAHVEGA